MILRRPALLELYALTMITVLGQFTIYSYISPFLASVGGLSEESIVDMLFVFGLAGIAGAVIGSRVVDRSRSFGMLVPIAVMALCHLAVGAAAGSIPVLSALVFVWGAAMTIMCLAFQTQLLSAAPDAADVATSLYSGIFNIGIGGGAFIGSRVSESLGFGALHYVSSALVLTSLAIMIVVWIKTGSPLFKTGFEEAPRRESGDPL